MLQVFLVALTALTLFMLVIGLTKEAQQQGLGLLQILSLIPYVLPDAMRFAVPGTILFAVASVFGRFSSSNEIIALKAAVSVLLNNQVIFDELEVVQARETRHAQLLDGQVTTNSL